MPRKPAEATVPFLAACTLLALVGCQKSELGRAGEARLVPRADGGAQLVVPGWPDTWLAPEEVAGRTSIELSHTDGADSVAFKTVDGKWVTFVWLGPKVHKGPALATALDFEGLVGKLVAEGPESDALLASLRASKGRTGLAKVLVRAASDEGPTWEKRLATLSPDERVELGKGLEGALLAKETAPKVLTRAIAVVDLAGVPADRLFERIAPVVGAKEPEGSHGASVILRFLAGKDAGAGKLACKGLDARPWKLDEPDPEKHLLLDAMLLAIAREGVDCAKVDTLVREDPCASTLRCGPSGPVLPNETTEQIEPLCDAAALEKAVKEELGRAPADVATDGHPGRTPGLAYAAHVLGKRPALADVEKRHARRLYALTQKGPACASLTEVGKPCQADPGVVRDMACRNDGADVTVGTLKIRISDEKKTISDVVTASPP